MKKILILILLFIAVSCYGQVIEEKVPRWIETSTAYVLEGALSDIDSTDTGITSAFDATPIVGRFLLADSMTAVKGKNAVLVYLRIKGGNSVDSLGYVRWQTMSPLGTWITTDTLPTNKSTGIWTALALDVFQLTKEARIDVAGIDLTASGYDMKLEYQIIIPKRSY